MLAGIVIGLVIVFAAAFLLRRTKVWWLPGVSLLGLAGTLGWHVSRSPASPHDDYGMNAFGNALLIGAAIACAVVGMLVLGFSANARSFAERTAKAPPRPELPAATVVDR